MGQRVQLLRAFSKLGWGSRGQAAEQIKSGVVTVNGRVEKDPLSWVELGKDVIKTKGEGKPAGPKKSGVPLVAVMYKPAGYVTTARDELNRIWVLRKVLNPLSPVESMELIIDKLAKSKSNQEFLSSMSNGGGPGGRM